MVFWVSALIGFYCGGLVLVFCIITVSGCYFFVYFCMRYCLRVGYDFVD